MPYVIYGTRVVVSLPIQHSASPRAVYATQPHPSCYKLCKAVLAYIKRGLSWQKCFLSENECLDGMKLVYIFYIFF